MARQETNGGRPGAAELLSGIVCDARDLFAKELETFKLEAQDELRQARNAALMLAIGVGVVGLAGLLLSLMAVYLLDAYSGLPLWGCYGIVGAAIAALGLVLLWMGKDTAADIDFVPRESVGAVREDVKWIQERAISAEREKMLEQR